MSPKETQSLQSEFQSLDISIQEESNEDRKSLLIAKREEYRKNLVEYKIKKGDSLSKIATNFHLNSYEDLIILNQILGIQFKKDEKIYL